MTVSVTDFYSAPSLGFFLHTPMTVHIQIGNTEPAPINLLESITQFQLLPALLRELVVDRAISEIVLTPTEHEVACQRFYEQQQITDPDQEQRWLSHYRMNRVQLEQQAVRQMKLEKFKSQSWEALLESDFLEQKSQYDRYIYSLIRHSSAELIQELYFRVQEGEQSFAELATEFSQGGEAKTGGTVGPVAAANLHPALARILRNCKPGQLMPPKRIGELNLIVRLEHHLPAQLTEEVRQQLLEKRYQGWLNEQLQATRLISAPIPVRTGP